MKVVGFVTEYNPFHLGHKYHLEQSKKMSNSTHTIAVMSGSFVQRGEPSLIDKWTKAKIAVENGVDLVIELPFIYSVQSAELFAYGAISILNSLNIVKYLSFGSETENLRDLERIANIFHEEPEEYKSFLKSHLSKGHSFSAARSKALTDYINMVNPYDNTPYERILKQSNNILSIEYLKSLKRLESEILPVLIKRKGNKYNDTKVTTQFPSATAIRNKLLNNNLETIKHYVPNETYENLIQFKNKYGSFNSLTRYNQVFQYIFRTLDKYQYNEIFDMENGLENRILASSEKNIHIESLIKDAMTKRYPSTRIKRILIHLLTNLDKETITYIYNNAITYIRILASNEKGLEIIREIKKKSNISVVTKFANYRSLDDNLAELMLKYESKATDLYYLGIATAMPIVNMDYLKSPYILK
ncbi:MAG: nucleotidyltransferase [Tissierellia bacterium]|nr:nucleotidyltransferase [Tissierellia bacterium]